MGAFPPPPVNGLNPGGLAAFPLPTLNDPGGGAPGAGASRMGRKNSRVVTPLKLEREHNGAAPQPPGLRDVRPFWGESFLEARAPTGGKGSPPAGTPRPRNSAGARAPCELARPEGESASSPAEEEHPAPNARCYRPRAACGGWRAPPRPQRLKGRTSDQSCSPKECRCG